MESFSLHCCCSSQARRRAGFRLESSAGHQTPSHRLSHDGEYEYEYSNMNMLRQKDSFSVLSTGSNTSISNIDHADIIEVMMMLMMTEPGGQVGQRWEEEELVNIDSPVG